MPNNWLFRLFIFIVFALVLNILVTPVILLLLYFFSGQISQMNGGTLVASVIISFVLDILIYRYIFHSKQ